MTRKTQENTTGNTYTNMATWTRLISEKRLMSDINRKDDTKGYHMTHNDEIKRKSEKRHESDVKTNMKQSS